jgi:hypothetical protein
MKTIQIKGDPNLRERLRDLPTGYLLDLLADQACADEWAVRGVLAERGLETGEIETLVRRRNDSRLPRSYTLWRMARIFTVVCTLLVGTFDLLAYIHLLHGEAPLKGLMLGLTGGGTLFGFLLGFKLTTHLYQGARHRLDCGFPLPVGSVDLQTGHERLRTKPMLIVCMAINASVGLALVLFPLLLMHHLLS